MAFFYKILDLRFTFSKVNVFGIIIEHFRTLKRTNSKRISIRDIFTFFILPGIVGFIIIRLGLFPEKDIINIIIAALAIFAGFLFNLLAIVFGLSDKLKANVELASTEFLRELKSKLLKEVHTNISFNILLSVICILALLSCLYNYGTSQLIIHQDHISIPYRTIAHFITYYLLVCFLLTLLMVLNRIHILLKKEF